MNFATVMLLICLLIFVNTNHFIEKKTVRVFSAASMMVLILVLADSIEYWCASFDEPTMLRIWMSAIGYSLRPSIIFLTVSFVSHYEKN